MNAKEIQTLYEKHQLLSGKGYGAACTLTGKTAMLLFYVNDSVSKWTDSAREAFSRTHTAAMETVVREAEKYAVRLTIDTIAEEVTMPFACDTDAKTGDTYKWASEILDRYNRKVFRGYKYHFKETLGYDQVAVAFAFNRDFRAHATLDDRSAVSRLLECSVLDKSASKRTIIHELFHQFGAADLYYPNDVAAAVRKHNYRSLMGSASGIPIDNLTAYVIGWTDEIDDTTVALLEETKHLRLKDIYIGRKKS